MTSGTPVNRDWVYVLQDGTIVIEWEEGNLQDVQTGDFLRRAPSATLSKTANSSACA